MLSKVTKIPNDKSYSLLVESLGSKSRDRKPEPIVTIETSGVNQEHCQDKEFWEQQRAE